MAVIAAAWAGFGMFSCCAVWFFVVRRTRSVRSSLSIVVSAAALIAGVVGLGATVISPAGAAVAPTGNGFTVTPGDLAFILKQIKISEHHAATFSSAHPCDTLVGPGPDQIPDRLTYYGLRTVDGSCNNLSPGREKMPPADVPFPRLSTTPVFRDAETNPDPGGNLLPNPTDPTSYKQKL